MSGRVKKANASKRYSKEFKLGAVKLVVEEGRKVSEIAKDLGVSEPALRQWVAAYRVDQGEAFPGSGRLKPKDEEIRRLREENRLLKAERDILKKTMGLFVERPK